MLHCWICAILYVKGMKIKKRLMNILLAFLCASMWSCSDDMLSAGASALGQEDDIRVKSDTFSVSSALEASSAISLTPDSFLLGECDTHFGTIKADILAQFACPVGFEYPYAETAVVDSVCLHLYYASWHGDGQAPLGISVYEMDRATMDYNTPYPSDTALSTFCSLVDSTRITKIPHVIIPQTYVDSAYDSSGESYVPAVIIKLSDEFAKRFFGLQDFSSQEAFNELFKGLYITTDFGGSSVLYISEMSLNVYYHFSYPRQGSGVDTVINDSKAFYANSEVRQLNRFSYPDRAAVLQQYGANKDTNYIVSPANIYTKLSLRMDSILNRMEEQLGDPEGYRVYVNRANLTVDVLYDAEVTSDRPRDSWNMPSNYMLLVLEDKMETFFLKNEVPSDTTAILSSLTAATDTLGNISYSYTYDLSGLLTQQLRNSSQDEYLNFYLVPVAVETSTTSSSVSRVKQLQTITTTYIRSAKNTESPMDVEMVYSGFNKAQH